MVPALPAPFNHLPLNLVLAVAAVVRVLLVLWLAEWRRRHRAQGAASTALGQLRTITATMREGVIAYDMDLRLTMVNPAFERLTGYPLEDLQDQEFLQYIHPDDRPALVARHPNRTPGLALALIPARFFLTPRRQRAAHVRAFPNAARLNPGSGGQLGQGLITTRSDPAVHR